MEAKKLICENCGETVFYTDITEDAKIPCKDETTCKKDGFLNHKPTK